MAKKYLSLDRLTEYDALLKAQMAESDELTLESAKGYADEKLATLTSGTTTVAKAEQATTATKAETADKATEATHATTADTATNATNASHAVSADTATNATNAANANHATTADSAINATNATKATQDASGNVITDTYETKLDATAKLEEAKAYADGIKNDLLNGAGEAYDTLKELGDLIDDNKDALGALETVATGKADKEHTHVVADITDYVAPVQADWNQNDETALDYVKNRPFYTGKPVETVILEGTPTFGSDPFGIGFYMTPMNYIEFELGRAYVVLYDGTRYECVAYEVDGLCLIGNSALVSVLVNGAQDTGEPFVFCPIPNMPIIVADTLGEHNIVLSIEVPEIIKIDEKYLPDSALAPADWDQNDSSSPDYIENRPFYRSLEYDDILYNFTFEGTEYYDTYSTFVNLPLAEGESYTINFDGVTYENVLYTTNGLADGWYRTFTEYPFGIYIDYGDDGIGIYAQTEGSHEIAIYGPGYVYTPLSEKYIPSSAASNWIEEDSSKVSYVHNKPFSSYTIDNVIFDGEVTANSSTSYNYARAIFYSLPNVKEYYAPNDQVVYDVIINGVEYKNLIISVNLSSPSANIGESGIGAPFDSELKNIQFTEELPFRISMLHGHNQFNVPAELLNSTFTLKVTARGRVINKLPEMYQHQADWNELTDTKASFIENKPFGEYLDYELVPVVERTILSMSNNEGEDDGYYKTTIGYESSSDKLLDVNKRYTIVINNTRFDNIECLPYKNISGSYNNPSLGTFRYLYKFDGMEYPFFLEDIGGSFKFYMNLNKMSLPEEFTFYLYEYVAETKIKTIDPKYLPFDISDSSVEVIYSLTTHTNVNVGYDVWDYEFRLNDQIPIYRANVGETYIVTYDGIEYECVCWNAGGYTHLGNPELTTLNLSLDETGPDESYYNDEPFVIICDVYNVLCSGEGPHTIGIVKPIAGEIIAPVATKAIYDSVGNVIVDTYETKSDAYNKLTEAKDYTDTEISKLTNGTTPVANATNAANATKAAQDASGNVITDTYETKTDASAKLEEAKGYADTAASNAATAVKNELLNGAGEAYDTLKELGDLIDDNKDALGALETIATGKADKEHKHTVEDIEGYTAGVQSDWNQDDPESLEYIKNRPFYETAPVETVLFEETAITVDDELNEVIVPGDIPFIAGETYTVVLDGVTYKTEAWINPVHDNADIGDGRIYDQACGDANMPFYIYLWDDGYYITTRNSGDHTISISTVISDIKTIDHKYLPEHLQFGEGTPIETVVLEEITVSPNDDGYYLDYFPLEEGKTYAVTIDGNTRNYIAWLDLVYGDIIIANPWSGEFGINSSKEYNSTYIGFADGGTHTVSISLVEYEIDTLETKYLPEHLQFGEEYTSESYVELVPRVGLNPPRTGSYETINTYFEIIPGNKYIVIYASQKYECIAWYNPDLDCGVIGDRSIYDGNYTGEPFAVACVPGEQTARVYKTVSWGISYPSMIIYGADTNVKPLDPKYLPFETVGSSEIICPETTQTVDYNGGGFDIDRNTDSKVFIDEYYTVTFDGVEYKCKCYSINGYRHLGNPNLLTNPGGNGSDLPSDPSLYANNEPFVIVCDVGSLLCAESGTHTISITGPSYTSGCIVSLAQKAIEDSEGNVISETYALKSDLDSIDLSGAVSDAKAYTDEVIGNITNGTTTVSKATTATKATQDASGNVITSTYETKADATAKLSEAKEYADSIKNDLLNGAGAAYDTLKELGDLIDDNQDAIDALETVAAGKADKEHTHSWNDLEDKPFGETDPVETVFFDETIPANSDMPQIPISVESLIAGEKYTVIYDGTTYSDLEAVSITEGDLTAVSVGSVDASFDDYPFLINTLMNIALVVLNDNTVEHSIKLIGYYKDVIQLDEKYISYKPGLITTGNTYMIDGVEVVSQLGAEVFNTTLNTATGMFSHAEGVSTTASGNYSHAEGTSTIASGEYGAHAEGQATTASGESSHAEGTRTTASGHSSHAEGSYTIASGKYSHAEGNETTASGEQSHAEGAHTTASGEQSHAEGDGTTASGDYSHAEGAHTTASGEQSHAEGSYTIASNYYSHAEGLRTIAAGACQHVQGKYNIEEVDATGKALNTYAHIVGNGTGTSERSNAHTLDWDGNAWFAGDVYVGSTSGINKDDGSKKLMTESDVDAKIENITTGGITVSKATNADNAEKLGNQPASYYAAASTVNTNTSAILANTNSITAHTTAIGNLQTAVAEFEEITAAEITALFA